MGSGTTCYGVEGWRLSDFDPCGCNASTRKDIVTVDMNNFNDIIQENTDKITTFDDVKVLCEKACENDKLTCNSENKGDHPCNGGACMAWSLSNKLKQGIMCV